MRRYLLDTSVLAAYFQRRESAIRLLHPLIERHELATSILVYAEVTEYIKGHSHAQERQQELRHLLREIYPYFLTYAIVERYADLTRALRPPYGSGLIGDMDTLIAATAPERNLIMITADHDFERVPLLTCKFVDFSKAA